MKLGKTKKSTPTDTEVVAVRVIPKVVRKTRRVKPSEVEEEDTDDLDFSSIEKPPPSIASSNSSIR